MVVMLAGGGAKACISENQNENHRTKSFRRADVRMRPPFSTDPPPFSARHFPKLLYSAHHRPSVRLPARAPVRRISLAPLAAPLQSPRSYIHHPLVGEAAGGGPIKIARHRHKNWKHKQRLLLLSIVTFESPASPCTANNQRMSDPTNPSLGHRFKHLYKLSERRPPIRIAIPARSHQF